MPLVSPALAPAQVNVDRRADGVIVLDSVHPLGAVPRHVVDLLRRWAGEAPDRVFLAERDPAGGAWRRVTYGEARRLVDRLAQGLVERGLGPARPLLIL